MRDIYIIGDLSNPCTLRICEAATGLPIPRVRSMDISIAAGEGTEAELFFCSDQLLDPERVRVVSAPGTEVSQAMCADCDGSGKYQGLLTITDCPACGGRGKA